MDDTGRPSACLHVERSTALPAYRVTGTNQNLEAVVLCQPAASPTQFTCAEKCSTLHYQPISFVPTLVCGSVTVLCTTAIRSVIAEDLFSGIEKILLWTMPSCPDFLFLLFTLFFLFFSLLFEFLLLLFS